MSDGIFELICAAFIFASARWYVPREMRRIRTKIAARTDPALFDARIHSRAFRVGVSLAVGAGLVAMLAGVVTPAGH
jgi:uncharacterized membrane protein